MTTAPNFQLYVLLLVAVILLIVLLWFLLRNPWRGYAARITSGLLASNAELKNISWSPISAPDANGIRTTNGVYELTGDAGRIGIITAGKDEKAIKEFTDEVKFHFEPILEKAPSDPMRQLRELFSQNNRRADKYQGSISSRMPVQESSSADDLIFEQYEDLFVEFAIQLAGTSEPNDPGKQVQAIAFIIDPRLAQGKSKTYSANVTAVYDTVSVSNGSVDATLKKGGTEIDSGSVGTGGSDVMSSTTYSSSQNFKLKVKGTSGSNCYRLSGTWNVS